MINLKTIITTVFLTTLTFSTAVMAAENKVILSGLHLENTPNGIMAIVGEGQNNTDSILKNVYIKFNLYQNNMVVSDTIDSVANLSPGQSFKVQAFVNTIKGKPDSFKVTEISTY